MIDSGKKILMVSVSIIGMISFVFFEYFGESNEGTDLSGFINPSELDEAPSKQDVYAEKRKKDRQAFSFDRKVNSLDDFLAKQVEKNPFDEVDTLVKMLPGKEKSEREKETSDNEVKASQTRTIKSKAELVATDKTVSDVVIEKVPERRVGFATGRGSVPPEDVRIGRTEDINVLSVVQDDMRVKSGIQVRLRILEPFNVGSVVVPSNTLVFGRARFSKERILIEVGSIPIQGQILELDLKAYDISGNEGIYVEGGLEEEVQGDVFEQTVSEVQRSVNVPILRNVPFTAAKKKIKEPEVPIAAGFKLYLRN